MTTLTRTDDTVDIVDAVRALAPSIVPRSEEIERCRRVPQDLVDDLAAAGCFRSLVPAALGGPELSLPAQMRANEELARADGSVGWVAMIGAMAPALFGFLPRETLDAVYGDGPDVILAGALNPTGVATPVGGGFRVSGQWAFASGCEHSHWFLAHCRVDDGRVPPVRMMLLPPGDVEIKDTWSVAGLCGTASHDFAADGAFVPTERSFVVGGPTAVDAPLFRVPLPSISALECAAVAVGIAQGAVDEITALAAGKVPAFDQARLAANPIFQNQLGSADATLRAARALLYADATTVWTTAAEGRGFTPLLRAQARATSTWVTRTAATVVDAAYTAGGGSSLYTRSPLQRRLRDIHAVTQHFGVKLDTLTKAGAVIVGEEVDLTMF
jgi:alkylation response protein AidB-like acyl-CoA dehydrogenase